MLKRLPALAAGLAVVLAGVTIATPAHAAIPPSGVKLNWLNSTTNFCLGVAAGNVTNGTAIIVWACNGNTDQAWTAESVNPFASGPYLLRNGTNRNKCLSVAAMSKNNGAVLVIWDCKAVGANSDQLWTFKDGTTSGTTNLVNVNSGLLMGVQGGSLSEGATVMQWQDLGHGDQQWFTTPAPPN
jgi:Ricin-type beta-trefoil lectin domain